MAANAAGYGLIGAADVGDDPRGAASGASDQPSVIVRASDAYIGVVHETPGRVVNLATAGDFCAAVVSNPEEVGRRFGLFTSTDAGRSWAAQTPIPVTSVLDIVVTELGQIWILTPNDVIFSAHAGFDWTQILFPESTRRTALGQDLEGIAVLSENGLTRLGADGTPGRHEMAGMAVADIADGHALVFQDGRTRVVRRTGEPLMELADRLPLALASSGAVVSALTRNLEPTVGPDIYLHRSSDGGGTWAHVRLGVTPACGIAGDWGLGLDIIGRIFIG